MRSRVILILTLSLGFFAGPAASAYAQGPPAQESVAHQGALAPGDIPAAIKQAVESPERPEADKRLDAGREPMQMMAFFGIAPGMRVADLFAGGGYTTELMARIVGPTGKVYSQNIEFSSNFKRIEQSYKERLKRPGLGNVVPVTKAFDADDLLPVEPGTLDAVVMNLNYHDLVWMGVNRGKMNATILKALKPGGVYGIVDHSAEKGSGGRDVKTLHRIDQQMVEDEITRAGFRLAATSNALSHPEDDRTWGVFVRRGQTDRFMLKFVKP